MEGLVHEYFIMSHPVKIYLLEFVIEPTESAEFIFSTRLYHTLFAFSHLIAQAS